MQSSSPGPGGGRNQSDDQVLDKREEKRNAQLMLPPPPRHCPHCTTVGRPPSAALGRETCGRMEREPGARLLLALKGIVCEGLL
jgi:hypothetical protein